MTVDNVIDALVTFLGLIMPVGTQVVRGQANRSARPASPAVILTELTQPPLETTVQTYTQPTSGSTGGVALTQQKQIDIQADFYGATAGDMCEACQTAFRSVWGASQFPAGISPLFTDQGRQAPLVSGEQQYVGRWILTLSLQYAPTLNVAQQFASQLAIERINPVF